MGGNFESWEITVSLARTGAWPLDGLTDECRGVALQMEIFDGGNGRRRIGGGESRLAGGFLATFIGHRAARRISSDGQILVIGRISCQTGVAGAISKTV